MNFPKTPFYGSLGPKIGLGVRGEVLSVGTANFNNVATLHLYGNNLALWNDLHTGAVYRAARSPGHDPRAYEVGHSLRSQLTKVRCIWSDAKIH
jgi:hypothetical protein